MERRIPHGERNFGWRADVGGAMSSAKFWSPEFASRDLFNPIQFTSMEVRLMKTIDHSPDTEAQKLADLEAVMRNLTAGGTLDPDVLQRVQERSRRITEEIRRTRGNIDIEQLLHDARSDS